MSPQSTNLCILPSRILLATDLKDLSQTLPIAISEAQKCKAKLKLIHVLSDGKNNSRVIDRESAKPSAESTLERAARDAWNSGVMCSWVVRTGPIPDAIWDEVAAWRPDRIVIGSHNSYKSRYLVLGSVTEVVLRESEIPVLVVGPAVRLGNGRPSGRTRILFATPLNRESRAVTESALEYAQIHQSDLTMLHVIPDIVKAHPSTSRVQAYAEHRFQETLSNIDPDIVKPDCMIERGHVVETILRVAKEGRFDLILMGTVSGSSFRRDIMPGTAYGVICKASCPVIVLKEAFSRISVAS